MHEQPVPRLNRSDELYSNTSLLTQRVPADCVRMTGFYNRDRDSDIAANKATIDHSTDRVIRVGSDGG